MRSSLGFATGLVSVMSLCVTTMTARAANGRLNEPLPVDVAASVTGHDSRSSFMISPDGEWIAHTVRTDDFLPNDSLFFSSTGAPFAEGNDRKEAHLTNTRTGEEILLGSPRSSSWAPTWSPDGQHVAFYSDEGGTAGLWIWDRATRRADRFPGVIVHPFFGWEVPRWSADGRRVLCKILPEGMTIQEANALSPPPQTKHQFPRHSDSEAGVIVLRPRVESEALNTVQMPTGSNRNLADLALLDLKSRSIRRIARRDKILWYAFSPDQRSVAYTDMDGYPQSGPLYGIKTLEIASGRVRTLGLNMALYYGIELSWSPDSTSLALVDRDAKDAPRLAILPADGSPLRPMVPMRNVSPQDVAPRWSGDGRFLYVSAGTGELWKADARTGADKRIAELAGVQIETLVSKFDDPVAWTTDRGRYLWAIGLREQGAQPSVLRIDAATGEAKAKMLPSREIEAAPSIDANDATGEIAFVAKDQQHPSDVWAYDTKRVRLRQVSHLNQDLDRYALGDARVIDFRAGDGKILHAALLLPPGFRPGRPLPTVVWVYGGQYGSHAVHRFGFEDDTPTSDMHVLATRGYAVLFPDAPIIEGDPVKSLMETVLPAVDAAIAQGFSDPARLAIMGHSYGAYSVLALITHTKRFKAAVAMASVINPDLLASYLDMPSENSMSNINFFEQGQGSMGGSPWQYRDRYIENSPIYSFNNITTPLLMEQGADDTVVSGLSGSDAAFSALRRLGKDVEYRIYQGEGHNLQRRADVIDFWNRRLTFLAEHLGIADHDASLGSHPKRLHR